MFSSWIVCPYDWKLVHFSQLGSEVPKPLSMRRNSLSNLVGCLFYQGCQWFITVLVAVLSGYEDAGVLAYAMAIGNIFLPIASYNLRTYQISDLSEKYTDGEYLAFRFVSIAFAFAVVIPYTAATTIDRSVLIPVFLYMLFKMDEAVVDVLSGIHQKGGRMDYIGISQLLRGVFTIVSFSAGLKLAGDISVAFLLMCFSCVGITLFFDLPHARRFKEIDVVIHLRECRSLFVTGLPLMASSFMSSMVVSFARQVYGNMSGAEMLGIYASVATPSILIQAAGRYLYSPGLVPLAHALTHGGIGEFKKAVSRVSAFLMFGAFLLGLCLIAFGPKFLEMLYGTQINQYSYLLTGMVVATCLNTVQLFLSDVLVICRDLRAALLVSMAALLPSLLLSVPFETAFSMQGINLTIIVSYGVSLCVALVRLMSFIKKGRLNE